jgi:putative membrane protein
MLDALRQVLAAEWLLLRRHRRLALAFAGVVFVPALYAYIYLASVWDPGAHSGALPAALVSRDTGASYRGRELNLGNEVLESIERQRQFDWRRYDDAEAARRDVRRGVLAFVLEIPADFSRQAVPGERAGAAQLRIYTSEGNHFASAGFARRFAPEVAQRVNTRLAEARWELVLSTAAGSRKSLDSLRDGLAELDAGAGELQQGLAQARDGSAALAGQAARAGDAVQRLRAGSQQLAEGAQQLAGGVRQAGTALRALDARRPPEPELAALRGGARQLVEGQRTLGTVLEQLAEGSGRLLEGVTRLKEGAEELPLFGGPLVEGAGQLQDGMRELGRGLGQAGDGSTRLLLGAQRLEEGVTALTEATARAGTALAGITARLPDDARLDSFADGARELQRGHEALDSALRPALAGTQALGQGLERLADGGARLQAGLALLRGQLPAAVDAPGGSAQGLAASVLPVVEVVAPVANNGVALAPNFVPLALWVGAVMAAFLVHWHRVPQPLAGLPRPALALGKLALPAAVVLLQAALMLAMLHGVLQVPMPTPGRFAAVLALASLTFLALVFALIRVFGDLGRVLAVLLLVVQVSAAGALLPIELSDAAFQAMHPYLPLTWVLRAFRVALFGAFEGVLLPSLAVVAATAAAALAAGVLLGRWRPVPPAQWRPPLDIE